MRRLVLILCACCFTPGAWADKESRDQAIEIANAYADCTGYWEYMAESAAAVGKPSVSQGMHNLANGAKTTALYFLAMEWTLSHPKEPRAYGSFAPQIEGQIETSLIRFRGMQELEDYEGIQTHGKLCQDLLPTQEKTLQAIRNASAGNP